MSFWNRFKNAGSIIGSANAASTISIGTKVESIDGKSAYSKNSKGVWVKDEVTVSNAADSSTLGGKTVTEIQTEAASAAVNSITDGAGAAYDTLKEIEAAVKANDADVATILNTQADKANKDLSNVATLPASVVAQLKGDTGAIGPQGIQGSKGATGAKGDTGATFRLSGTTLYITT